MKALDRISEAYYGKIGDDFGKETRKRIHWICSQVVGDDVLDVGCSQGIVESILARENKRVVGLDIEEESIQYARTLLAEKSSAEQENISFVVASVFDYETSLKFDTVILSEVMEHFADPVGLLEKTRDFMKEGARIIVTVPFGINDFIDHKQTFYFHNFLKTVESVFQVESVTMLGKWIAAIATNLEKRTPFVTEDALVAFEDNLYQVERGYINQQADQARKERALNENIARMKDQIRAANQELEDQKIQAEEARAHLTALLQDERVHLTTLLESERAHLTALLQEERAYSTALLDKERQHAAKQAEQADARVRDMEALIGDYQQRVQTLQADITSLESAMMVKNNELTIRQDSEETVLMNFKNAMDDRQSEVARYQSEIARYRGETADYKRKLDEVTLQYQALRNSKLGRLTVKYWSMRGRNRS